MLTGTPLDNTWEDAFALFSLLRDHPVRTLEQFQSSFSDWEKTPQDHRFALVPTGFFQERLIQMLDAFMLRRPESLMTEGLPPLSRYNVEFELKQEDLEQSNDHFRQYKKTARTLAAIPLARTGGRRFNKWSSLILAQQYACHAAIIELMDQFKARMLSDPDDPDNDVDLADLEATALHHDENRKIHLNWMGSMRIDENWRSPRVDVVLDIFDRHKTLFQSAKVVVVDESIFCSRVSNACLGLTLPLLS